MAKREAEAKRAQEYAMNGHKSGPRTAEDAEREAKEAEQAVAHLREGAACGCGQSGEEDSGA